MSKIYITKHDLERLNQLLAKRKPHDDNDKALIAELSNADVVEPKAIPSDVITMNSRVKFKDEHGDSREYSLVFPNDADIVKNKISILSPIGCSLIGYKVGSTISIPTPKGKKDLIVEEILYQPERSGDLDL